MSSCLTFSYNPALFVEIVLLSYSHSYFFFFISTWKMCLDLWLLSIDNSRFSIINLNRVDPVFLLLIRHTNEKAWGVVADGVEPETKIIKLGNCCCFWCKGLWYISFFYTTYSKWECCTFLDLPFLCKMPNSHQKSFRLWAWMIGSNRLTSV